ncbi:MAG: AsmA family protein, partial [Alphaproteobacteria bacterium]
MLKKIAIGFGVFVALIVVALFAVPALIDWNGYKPRVAAAVKDATGRDLVIEGDLSVTILPRVRFSADRVKFANAPGAEPAYMATVDRVEGEVALLPLVGRTIVVERLVVERPQADLQIDERGNPNWAFAAPDRDGMHRGRDGRAADDGEFGGDVRIENARIVGGRVTFADARTGQKVDMRDIEIGLSVPGLADVAVFDARMAVNDDPVRARFTLDTPRRLLAGEKATAEFAFDAPKARANYQGGVQNRPVPGLDGTFELDIPSVGTLVAWLGRPLPSDQPDPGPVRARAVFDADGPRIALTEAILFGEDLKAEASGSIDLSGPAPKVVLKVESGVLNVDRYLPPPAAEPIRTLPPRPATGPADAPHANPLAALSDEALDLDMLRRGEVDIDVRIEGIRAMGFAIGPTEFGARLRDGRFEADLSRLELYGGVVKAATRLDATGAALTLDTRASVDKVDMGALAKAAAPTEQAPVAGVVSATLEASGTGESPRRLAESLKGRLTADLGGMNVRDAAAAALSGLKLDLVLPGVGAPPRLTADFVYNREKVSVQAQTSPLPRVVSGDRFDLDASVRASLLTASYTGAVIKAPVAGLDGSFNLDAPSAAKIAAWLGRPLEGQPDPGPIKARAVFAGDGGRVVLREATLASAGLDATARGSWEMKGDVTHLTLDVKGGVLDLDRFVGPAAPPRQAPRATAGRGDPNPLAALPNDPIDSSALRTLDADVKLDLAGIRGAGQSLGRVVLAARIERGVVSVKLDEVALHGGRVGGTIRADASGRALAVDAALQASGIRIGDVLQAAGGPPALTGTVAADLSARSQGASARALADNLAAKLGVKLSGGGAEGAQLPVSALDLALALAGPGKPASLRLGAVYNGESVTATGTVADQTAALSGARFPASFTLASAPLSAAFEGTVQQAPLPRLDGRVNVDIASVGRLASWLGQPIDPKQPDPGPLKIAATLTADGPRIAVRQASIDGRALKATAEGSLDTTASPRRFGAKVVVQEADLDAYLPPPTTGTQIRQGQAAADAGWSDEPIDLAALRENVGEVDVTLNAVRYRGLAIEQGRLTASVKDGALTASLSEIRTAGGTIGGRATLADTGRGAKLAYDAKASGLAARPLLTAFAGTDRLSGTAGFAAKGTGSGRSQRDLMASLDGDGSFKFVDGAIHGVNIAALLRQVGAAGLSSSAEADQKTDFAELSGSYVIRKGIVENRDLRMLAPLVRLAGGGTVDLPRQTMDYTVDATLVATLHGQGGRDDLAGIPIPLRISGPWTSPRYDVQWNRMLQNIAKDPERLKNLPASLRDLAKGSGINLPIPGTGTGTGSGTGGAVGDVLRALPGVGGALGGGAGTGATGGATGGTADPLRGLL